jgi:hypothetical protein
MFEKTCQTLNSANRKNSPSLFATTKRIEILLSSRAKNTRTKGVDTGIGFEICPKSKKILMAI